MHALAKTLNIVVCAAAAAVASLAVPAAAATTAASSVPAAWKPAASRVIAVDNRSRFAYGTDSAFPTVTGSAPYTEPVLGGRAVARGDAGGGGAGGGGGGARPSSPPQILFPVGPSQRRSGERQLLQ